MYLSPFFISARFAYNRRTMPTATAAAAEPAAALGITLRQVSKDFGPTVQAVAPLDLTIDAGDFVALLGPSGCGKSTLLRLIANLDQPTTGRVELQGHTGGRLPIAYVFQDAHLLPWRNLLGNVTLPLELMGVGRAEREAAARQAIEQVGLLEAIKRYPAQLSGGMRMRVSLARALVTRPRLLLLDEPFAALDEITRQELDEALRALWLERRMTVVFVTHALAEAAFLARRAVVLSRRPARVMADHVLELPEQRDGALRTSAAFAAQARVLYDALHAGGVL